MTALAKLMQAEENLMAAIDRINDDYDPVLGATDEWRKVRDEYVHALAVTRIKIRQLTPKRAL